LGFHVWLIWFRVNNRFVMNSWKFPGGHIIPTEQILVGKRSSIPASNGFWITPVP
jgi:hypothetical protein